MPMKNSINSGSTPVLVTFISTLTAGGILLSELGKFPKISLGTLQIPSAVVGFLLIIFGVIMTFFALFKLQHSDKKSPPTGIYAHVRNPVCLGVFLSCTGAILAYGNAALLVFTVVMGLAGFAANHESDK